MELKFMNCTETSPEYDKKNGRHMRVNEYVVGNYKVIERIFTYESGDSYTTVETSPVGENNYLPRIYAREDILNDLGITGFEIQTTSYGALQIDEIQKIVIAFNEAIEVAQILTEKFAYKNEFKAKYDVLQNTVNDIEHESFEEAFEYYKDILTENGYELGISENGVHTIQSLDELCDILNKLDIYGCGSSFKIEQRERNE